MQLYLVIERNSVDYTGTFKEVVAIFKYRERAIREIQRLEKKNHNPDKDYNLEIHTLIEGTKSER